MPPLVVAGGALLTLHWSRGTSTYANVVGVNAPPGVVINQAVANSLDLAIKGQFATTGLAADISAGVTLQAVGIKDIRVANQPEFVGTAPPVPGTATGDPLPPSVALVTTLRTAKAGASFRGRLYLGGLTEAANDTGGACLSTVSGRVAAFWDAVRVEIAGEGMFMAVVSRPAEARTITKTLAGRPGGVEPVTALAIRDNAWDSQRRRASLSGATSFSPPVHIFEVS